jgi:hypothetical protein
MDTRVRQPTRRAASPPWLADLVDYPRAARHLLRKPGSTVFNPVQVRVNLPKGHCDNAVSQRLSRPMVARRHRVVGLACAWACAAAWAGDMTPAMQKEIAQLLDRIEASNCSFGRNGTWHPPADARKHLQMKIDYMVKRNMLASTEEFISKAATASSVSGEAYQIRCGGAAPMPSATWLTAELKRIRASY